MAHIFDYKRRVANTTLVRGGCILTLDLAEFRRRLHGELMPAIPWRSLLIPEMFRGGLDMLTFHKYSRPHNSLFH